MRSEVLAAKRRRGPVRIAQPRLPAQFLRSGMPPPGPTDRSDHPRSDPCSGARGVPVPGDELANPARDHEGITDGRYDSGAITVQFANSDVRQFQLVEDIGARQWTLRSGGKDMATLKYTREPDGTLSLEGRLAGLPAQIHLHPIDVNTLPLLRGN